VTVSVTVRTRSVAAAALALGLASAACSDDGGSEEAFCATARSFATDNPAAVFDRYDPADPTGAAELLRRTGTRLRAWSEEAPGDVDDDVALIADVADELAAAFEAPASSSDRTEELQARFTEVEEASARVTSYARERCGVELDPGAVAPPATVAPVD
jgi:hypothetical protein